MDVTFGGASVMPWTVEDMKKKGAQRPHKAAVIANAILKNCLASGGVNCERVAIATALKRTQ